MKLIKTLAILILLNSCNGQNKKKQSMDNVNNEVKTSVNNKFHEGEMNIDYDDFIKKNITKIESEINRFGYKKPNQKLFIEKIFYFFNWDINKYSNVIALQNSLQPEIVIKDSNLIFVEGEANEIDGETLYNYNEFIFNNNKNAFMWLKVKRPDLLIGLVKVYGYDKDDEVLKFVFKKIDFKNKIVIKDLIFDNKNDKLILRESLIQKIRLLEYDNKKIEGFSEVVQGDFYYTLPYIIELMEKNPNDYNDINYSIAYLMNEIALSGIVGVLESNFNNNPKYLKTLEKNNYYNLEKLKEYATIIYEPVTNSEDTNLAYKINDPDGFTNLRKEKSTTSTILEKVKTGESVEVIQQSGDWYLVKTKLGNEGYVFKTKIVSE